MPIVRPGASIAKLKREIIRSIDPGGAPPFVSEANLEQSGGSFFIFDITNPDGIVGESGFYIQAEFTIVDENKDVVHPGSYFSKVWW